MEERLGEMRKGRRERMKKGAIVSSSDKKIVLELYVVVSTRKAL